MTRLKLKPVAEQVVVVFGASSGIGRETALQFARRGAKVVVSARREQALNDLVAEIQAAGGEAAALPAEVTDFAAVKAVADFAVAHYGRIDTWVHLAAVAVYAPFSQTTPEEFKRVIDVNLTGQAYGALAALPYVRHNGGSLIHISSVEGEVAVPYHSAYAASKHGVIGMADALRLELAHEGAGVNVVNIMPASINTPFFDNSRTRLGVTPRGIPPVYEPDVAARAIIFAAEHPVRDLYVGGAGMLLSRMWRISPRLTDGLMKLVAFDWQKTRRPASSLAPKNLFSPVAGGDDIQGSMSAEARSFSLYTWLETHPVARRLVVAGLVAGLLASISRRINPGRLVQEVLAE